MAVLRRCTAAALLLILIVIVSVSSLTAKIRVCDAAIGPTDGEFALTSCKPLAVTDAPIILFILLVTALLAPDLTKIKIGGLLEVERKLDEQNTNIAELGHKIEILSVSTEASASNSVIMGNHYWSPPLGTWPPGVPVNADEDRLSKKRKAFLAGHGNENAE